MMLRMILTTWRRPSCHSRLVAPPGPTGEFKPLAACDCVLCVETDDKHGETLTHTDKRVPDSQLNQIDRRKRGSLYNVGRLYWETPIERSQKQPQMLKATPQSNLTDTPRDGYS